MKINEDILNYTLPHEEDGEIAIFFKHQENSRFRIARSQADEWTIANEIFWGASNDSGMKWKISQRDLKVYSWNKSRLGVWRTWSMHGSNSSYVTYNLHLWNSSACLQKVCLCLNKYMSVLKAYASKTSRSAKLRQSSIKSLT